MIGEMTGEVKNLTLVRTSGKTLRRMLKGLRDDDSVVAFVQKVDRNAHLHTTKEFREVAFMWKGDEP